MEEKSYLKAYEDCTLCPRKCHKNRLNGETGACLSTSTLSLARAALHFWEEPSISGTKGSGAVFFSGCPLHCVFCQNSSIANKMYGKEVSVERLVDIFFELKSKGANNINLVTPTHYTPTVAHALALAREKGLNLPIVYNTGGYESVATLKMLDGLVDVYLPDFKYYDEATALSMAHAKDYPEVAKSAIDEMVAQTGACTFDDETGLIKKGTIARVLVLPGHVNEAIKIVRYLYERYADNIYISIMSQYTPIIDNIPDGKEYETLKRKLTSREYDKIVNEAINIGITNAYIQGGESVSESFIPPFNTEGV